MTNTKNMTLFYSNLREAQRNTFYNHSLTVTSKEDLVKIVSYDHISAKFNNNHRKNINFIESNCNMFDVDNTHSDNPEEWKTVTDIRQAFPNVPFYVSYSRNHMKEKNGKAPRPKFHLYFPDVYINNYDTLKQHKERVCTYFPEFDGQAKDVAHFFYGVETPQVDYYDGEILLFDFMKSVNIPTKQGASQHTNTQNSYEKANTNIIPQGERNNSMFKYALYVLYNFNKEEAYIKFMDKSTQCNPALDFDELESIWNSASKYTISKSESNSQTKNQSHTNNIFELPVVDQNALNILFTLDKNKKKITIHTVRLILQAFGITVRYNDMSKHIEVLGMPKKYSEDNLCDILDTLISDTAVKLSLSRNQEKVVHNIVDTLASENHYHPVIELLNSMQWDGQDRLEEIYNILHIKDNFRKTLIKKWLIQTIAVLYNNEDNPVSGQGVLVLQGGQGIGKTEFFRHLAIKERFFKGGATLDMNNKDSKMSAIRVWICELGEIDSTTKKQQSALKAFLTERVDRFRDPYARHEKMSYRRTSFCGTVNPKQYLCDETGNRRYWSIEIEDIETNKIFSYSSNWYAQLWKQIQSIYNDNPKAHFLSTEEQNMVNSINNEFETELQAEDEFLTLYNLNAPINEWRKCTVSQIADELCKHFNHLNNLKSCWIGKTLLPRIEKRTGVEFKKCTVNNQRFRLFPPMNSLTSNINDPAPLDTSYILQQPSINTPVLSTDYDNDDDDIPEF